jgi:hypothetical protein
MMPSDGQSGTRVEQVVAADPPTLQIIPGSVQHLAPYVIGLHKRTLKIASTGSGTTGSGTPETHLVVLTEGGQQRHPVATLYISAALRLLMIYMT